jgi:NarL family two-component system response regulator LiaR
MDGVAAAEAIRKFCPQTHIVALTSFDDEHTVQDVLKAGATSYVMKNVSVDELANVIRKAHQGQATLAPEATRVLIRAATRPPSIGYDLSDREREVLALMAKGLSNREIGEQLYISSSTVKNHVSSILSKLGTVSRTQAVALAVEHRLVEPAGT